MKDFDNFWQKRYWESRNEIMSLPPLALITTASIRFSDLGETQGWDDVVGLATQAYTEVKKTVTYPSTNRVQRWATSFMQVSKC